MHFRAWLLGNVALAMVACGGGGSAETPCLPHAAVACACAGGGSGTALCNAAGTAVGACSCAAPALGDAGTDAPVASSDAWPGCPADLLLDPNNCGACNHGCLGGACVAGLCQPVAVAGTGGIGGIALDVGAVYWTSGTSSSSTDWAVQKIPAAGGAPVTLASGLSGAFSPIVDGLDLYWAERGTGGDAIVAAPLAGGAPTTLVSSGQVQSLALDATHLYFTDGLGSLLAAPRAGGVATTLVHSTTSPPQSLVVGPSQLYFTAASNVSPSDDSIQSVPLAGGATTTLVVNKDQFADGLVLAGSTLVWPTVGGLQAVDTTGAGLGMLTTSSFPNHLATDGTLVYSLDSGGDLVRVAVAGGTPTILLRDPAASDGAIAVDATAIYYGTAHGLMKVAR